MSSQKGAHAESGDYGSPVPKRTFGQKVKRSCARFWWAYLIALIVIALVVVLPVIFVGYPNIARHVVRDSTLRLVQQQILEPMPNSFKTNLTTQIQSSSPLSGTSAPFEGAIAFNDQVMWNLSIPEYKAANGEQVTVASNNVTVLNQQAFGEFSAAILRDRNVTLRLKGASTIKSGALQAVSITYDNEVQIAGLNGLEGLSVSDLVLNASDVPAGNNAKATVNIPNVSPLTLQLGRLTYDLAIDGTKVGNVSFADITLATGTKGYPATIYSDQTAIAPFLLKPKYQCGTVALTMYNGKSVYQGQEVPYLTYALQRVNTTSKVDLSSAIKAIGLGGVLKPTCES